jgi:predicted amidophosphoribosyltransferase
LSETIGGHCLPLLKRSRPELEQKALDRASRQQVTMELADGVSSRRLKQLSRKGWKFVFADDVFTTGATARAAWKALGEPKPFQIWTLSYRASLRSDS